jgi:diguanylate cyclase (GGDEF)-like protein/PAS domain S-box-containing protein
MSALAHMRRRAFRDWTSERLPIQAFLLMAVSITIVSVALIWHQGESIKKSVLAERFGTIARVASHLEAAVEGAGIGSDRDSLAHYLQAEINETMLELGALQAVITDETGTIVASANPAEIGTSEGAEEVRLVLSGAADSMMRPEKGEEERDFAFTIPVTFSAYRGVLHVEESVQELNQEIAAATLESALPALVILLVAAPFAALVAQRVLRRTQLNEQERAWRGRFQSVVQSASDVILIVDGDGLVKYASPATERVLGRDPADVHNSVALDLFHTNDLPALQAALFEAEASPGTVVRSECRVRHNDGHWVSAETHSTNLLEDPAVRGIVYTIRDLSERRALEANLRHQAFHDSLTGLANGVLFNDRLGHALARARRSDNGLAVLALGLDDFKLINDRHGHQAGDAVLAQVGQRILAGIREGDTAARLGGDEFAVLLDDVAPEAVDELCRRIVAVFEQPFRLEDGSVKITASLGVAEGDHLFAGMADLLTCADIAMYASKEAGKGRITVFEPGMRRAANERVEAVTQLRLAIEEGQLYVRYQPIVALPSGGIQSMEALVRWRHPVRGEVMPSEFIPLAEKTGLILPLGEFVLREACRQTRLWQTEDLGMEALAVSVNLSTAQLQDAGLIDAVRSALMDSGLPPASLTLEITESVLALDADETTSRLQDLKDIGVHLAVDDFGTGYSSLSYLRRFPVDFVKIDKSFVDGIGATGPGLALAKSIVRLAHNLQLKTIAEGVEHPQQLTRLTAMGCDGAQGYLFARPLDVKDATDYLRNTAARLSVVR